MNPFAIPMAFGLAGQLLSEMSENETKRNGQGQVRTAGIADSVQCPGVDIEAYEKSCRVNIFRDMWNRWKLIRSTADGLTLSEIEQSTKAFMGKLSASLDGKIRHVNVLPMGKAWPNNTLLTSRMKVCSAPMVLRASSYAPPFFEISVSFVYRGNLGDIPWPARKVDMGFGSSCPVNADWLLDAVYAPSQVDVLDVSADPVLPPQYSDIPGELGLDPGEWDPSTKLLVGGAVLLGVAVAAGYAVRSFK